MNNLAISSACRGSNLRRINPAILAWIGAACFAAAWLLLTAAVGRVAPVDNIEQLTWVRSLEWGYYKHPPLPTWLLWPLVQVFGLQGWTSYVLGALMTLAAVALVRSLVAQLCGVRQANLCALAILCVTYYNGRLYYYNHNVVLLLITAASAWTCWRALRTRRLGWWAMLGVLLGLGGLTKYQIAITAACVLACWSLERGWRDRVHRQGAALAAIIACAIFVPHLLWLIENDFPTIHYAVSSSLGAGLGCNERAAHSIAWVGDQIFNRSLPAWLMLSVTAFVRPRPARSARSSSVGGSLPPDEDRAAFPERAFLLVWGLLPLSLMTMVGITTGADLQLQWGTAFMPFVIPAVLVLTRRRVRWDRTPTSVMLSAFVGAQIVLMLVNVYTSPRGPAPNMHHWRAFDIETLAQTIDHPIRQRIGNRPICLISGPAAIAGALSLRMPERPLVLIDGRLDRSPWVARANLDPACAVLDVSQDHPSGFVVADGSYGQLAWRLRRFMDLSVKSIEGRPSMQLSRAGLIDAVTRTQP